MSEEQRSLGKSRERHGPGGVSQTLPVSSGRATGRQLRRRLKRMYLTREAERHVLMGVK